MKKPERFEHESYGMILFSRTMNGRSCQLFGSSLASHHSTIRMTVQRGVHEHDLHADRFYGKGGLPLIEVEMSAAQFAEAITSMNMGSGVPCTLRCVNQKDVEDPPDQLTEAQRVKANFADDVRDMVAEMKKRRVEIECLTDRLPAKSKQQLKIALDVMVQQLASNVPFVVEQFNEATDRITTSAKHDIEAFAMHALHVAGHEALAAKAAAPQLPDGVVQHCYQDPNVEGPRCALHDAVPDWSSELTHYKGPPGWVCPDGGLMLPPPASTTKKVT